MTAIKVGTEREGFREEIQKNRTSIKDRYKKRKKRSKGGRTKSNEKRKLY